MERKKAEDLAERIFEYLNSQYPRGLMKDKLTDIIASWDDKSDQQKEDDDLLRDLFAPILVTEEGAKTIRDGGWADTLVLGATAPWSETPEYLVVGDTGPARHLAPASHWSDNETLAQRYRST